ncbi:MAG TPA: serine hydrolase domain-containing protein [Gemmatimonadota bacterium]|nr:serine hydrolase domain-containing protein [Gemmatimonadota bacterium]
MIRRSLILAAAALAAIPILLVPPAAGQIAASGPATGVAAPSRVELPDTPAGRRAAEMLRISVEGDDTSTRAFIEGNFAPRFRDAFPIEDHVRINAEMREESGGYEAVEVRDSEPAAIQVVVRARKTGELHLMTLHTETEAPHRIDGVGVRPLMPADGVETPSVPDRALTDAEIASTLTEYLDRLVAVDGFSGAVFVARQGEPIFERAYGEASKSYHVPNAVDTKFNLGSMNKMFTAVSIAQLVEEGVLTWDDPVGKWLGSEWVRPEVGEKVTIRHLLTHTSGLGSFFTDEFMRSSRGLYRGLDDWREIVSKDSLAFEPGTNWAYSNTGFHLLGLIVEKASGKSYYDYVRERIYEPAGMIGTDAYEVDAVVPNLAQGYMRDETVDGVTWRSNILEHTARGGPAGGGYSTAPDLLAFARALADGRLLRPETVALITTPKPSEGSPDYGYGFQQWEDGRVFGHTGGFPGISSAMLIDRETGDVVVVMSNYGRTGRPVIDLARELLTAGS